MSFLLIAPVCIQELMLLSPKSKQEIAFPFKDAEYGTALFIFSNTQCLKLNACEVSSHRQMRFKYRLHCKLASFD